MIGGQLLTMSAAIASRRAIHLAESTKSSTSNQAKPVDTAAVGERLSVVESKLDEMLALLKQSLVPKQSPARPPTWSSPSGQATEPIVIEDDDEDLYLAHETKGLSQYGQPVTPPRDPTEEDIDFSSPVQSPQAVAAVSDVQPGPAPPLQDKHHVWQPLAKHQTISVAQSYSGFSGSRTVFQPLVASPQQVSGPVSMSKPEIRRPSVSSSVTSPARKRPRVESVSHTTGQLSTGLHTWAEEASILASMAKLLQMNTVQWRSPGQREAMRAVLRHRNDLIVVLATNAGKSMLAIMAAIQANRLSYVIVVVPLKSLLTHWMQTLDRMEVRFELYCGKPLGGRDTLILTTPEMAHGSMWSKHVGGLTSRPVSHVFVDEAHMTVSAADYRPAMVNGTLYRRGPNIQYVLLSGTVPPKAEHILIHNFGLVNPVVLREPTVRPEIEYKLYGRMGQEKTKQQLFTLVDQLLNTLPHDENIIIFVPFRNLAEEWSQEKGWRPYTAFNGKDRRWQGKALTVAKEEDSLQKDSLMVDFRTGAVRVIVATSALAAGYDHPRVRHVFSVLRPDAMLDLTQELHRAGRDGKHSVAHIMPSAALDEPTPNVKDPQDDQGKMATWRMISGGCLRGHITAFCDARAWMCWEVPGAQRCSDCQKKNAQGTNPTCVHLGFFITNRTQLRSFKGKYHPAASGYGPECAREQKPSYRLWSCRTGGTPTCANCACQRAQSSYRAQDSIGLLSDTLCLLL
jgi:hypothetical protein